MTTRSAPDHPACCPTQEKNTSRANFNSEEEWQAHKSKQETLPKAAFQFGLKMADGRKTHKNLVGKANNKLKNELNSIKVRIAQGVVAACFTCWRLAVQRAAWQTADCGLRIIKVVARHDECHSAVSAVVTTAFTLPQDILDKKGGKYGRAFEAEDSEPLGGGAPAKRKRVI